VTYLTIGGLSFDGGENPGVDVLEQLDGWFDGTDVEAEVDNRPQAHGAFETPTWHTGRTVAMIVSRRCDSDFEAGVARRELAALLAGGRYDDLTVYEPDGHTTSARVRLASKPLVRWLPYSQRVQAQVEFFAPDPLRYGSTVNAITTFPVEAGGLEFDLFTDGATHTGALEFGEAGSTGRAYLGPQGGTAPGHTQFLVTGPTPPFSIVRVETGRRIEFSRPVAAGAQLLIDTATGVVLIDGGDVDYSGLLTRWEWEPVEPGAPVTFAFLPHGPSDTGTLTVMHRAAWW